MKKELNVGIIGIGNMGSAHATVIGSGKIDAMRLWAVCDIDEERLSLCLSRNPGVKGYADWHELVNDQSVDAVIIAVPHPLHADIAIEALRCGKHVLTEKPVDVSITKALALNRAAQESERVFGIMFNQRTNPLFAKARKMMKSGELGELKRVVWIITNWYRTQSYYDSGSWRATWAGEGGGVLLNQAPHNLDLWQWICGMPIEITAFCDIAKYHEIEVEDDATIFARYKNGATGVFITSTGEYPGTNRFEISGTRGKLVIEDGKMKLWKLSEDERDFCVTSKEGFAAIPYEYEEIVQTEQETAHAGILQNFANAVLYGEELLAPGTDGIFELTISNAAYLSTAKGCTPVSIPLKDGEFDALLDELIRFSQYKSDAVPEKYNTEYHTRWQVRW